MSEWDINLENLGKFAWPVQQAIHEAHFYVAVTGAGISYASGLPLVSEEVQGIPLRSFFSQPLLNQAPLSFYDAYREILKNWRAAIPNEAHQVLAKHSVWVITQNVDGLHRDAGSQRLIELHGNLRELKCLHCQGIYSVDLVWQMNIPRCPACQTILCPGISLVGNEVRHWSRAVDWVGRADILFVVGTKLEMSPIHGLPEIMRKTGGHIIRVNESAERILPHLWAKQWGPL